MKQIDRMARGAAAAILLASAGCHHWQRVTPYAPLSSQVRVERTNGEVIVGTLLRRSPDSLYLGLQEGEGRARAIAIGDVRYIDQRVFSGKRNATWVAGAAAGAFLVYELGSHASNGSSTGSTIGTGRLMQSH